MTWRRYVIASAGACSVTAWVWAAGVGAPFELWAAAVALSVAATVWGLERCA